MEDEKGFSTYEESILRLGIWKEQNEESKR